MDIERRLKAHMDEFADRVEISTDRTPQSNKKATGPQRTLTAMTAILVVAMAGIGFWMLSDDTATTSLAAGDIDDVEESQANLEDADEADGADAETGSPTLKIVDVTSDDSPASGRVLSDGGVYYVLSTAPGPVDFSATRTDAQLQELYRQDTFYVLDGDRNWRVNSIEDRFVSDFAVNDGVLYVLSTGAPTGGEATLGTSTDFGSSWDWAPLEGFPEVDGGSLLIGDHGTLIFGSRSDRTDFDWVVKTASEAGLPVTSEGLLEFDSTGFSYQPIDTNDPCQARLLEFIPDIGYMIDYLPRASAVEQEDIRRNFEDTLTHLREEAGGLGCPFDVRTFDDLVALDLPKAVRVSWDELGIAIPESWKPTMGLYSFDDGSLTEKTLPFDEGIGWGWVMGDRLEVMVTPPGQSSYEFGSEVFWSTTDGDAWDSRRIDQDDPSGFLPPGYEEPRVGSHVFRVGWDEELVAEQQLEIEALERSVAAGEVSEEAMFEAFPYESTSRLERSTDGGPWAIVDPSTLDPAADLDGLALYDVQGLSSGVAVVYANPNFGVGGTSESNSVVLFSDDGESWTSFPVLNGESMFHSNGDTFLVLSHDWLIPEGETQGRTQALLVSPTP